MMETLLGFLILLSLQGSGAVTLTNVAQIESPEHFDVRNVDMIMHSEKTEINEMVTELKKRLASLERQSRDAGEEPQRRNRRSAHSCNCEEAIEDILVNEGGSIDLTECYTTMNGTDYRGQISKTQSGLQCQHWTEQSPHSHNITIEDHGDAGIGNHSYCRNPDGSSQPWCFTTHNGTEREACDVGKADNSCEPRELTWTGVTYTRYGRSFCPDGNELVYAGFVGGTMSIHEGGGVNFLCMPEVPIYERVEAGVQDTRAYVYHTEYSKPIMPGGLNNGDVPCAVCRVRHHSSVLMIPARNVCPDESWTLQYNGYLGAQRVEIRRHSSEFICLDKRSKKVSGSQRSVQGTKVFNVEGRCSRNSAMPCDGPYINGHELTCAVCSK